MRRRDAIGNPSDLAESFLYPALRLKSVGKGGTSDLLPLEPNAVHHKLEGRASREKREKATESQPKRTPPMDPPEEYHLSRRRGGLGKRERISCLAVVDIARRFLFEIGGGVDWMSDIRFFLYFVTILFLLPSVLATASRLVRSHRHAAKFIIVKLTSSPATPVI